MVFFAIKFLLHLLAFVKLCFGSFHVHEEAWLMPHGHKNTVTSAHTKHVQRRAHKIGKIIFIMEIVQFFIHKHLTHGTEHSEQSKHRKAFVVNSMHDLPRAVWRAIAVWYQFVVCGVAFEALSMLFCCFFSIRIFTIYCFASCSNYIPTGECMNGYGAEFWFAQPRYLNGYCAKIEL